MYPPRVLAVALGMLVPTLWVGTAFPATAQCPFEQEQKLLASNAQAQGYFGRSLAIQGDVLIVGSDEYGVVGTAPGEAYIFRLEGGIWLEEQHLIPSDSLLGDEFGIATAVSGDWAAVGVLRDANLPNYQGEVYMFRHDGTQWVETQHLVASDGRVNDYFGRAISLWGDTLLVGALGDDDPTSGDEVGAAYVFHFDGVQWVESQKLQARDGAAGDEFGRSVGLVDGLAIVGAPYADLSVADVGAAYVFRRQAGTFVEEQKLTPVDPDVGQRFGFVVAVDPLDAICGAPGDDQAGSNAGAVYPFRFDGSQWTAGPKLIASGGNPGDEFGGGVAVRAGVALIGAPRDDEGGAGAGAAYVLSWNGSEWSEENKLVADDAVARGEYGWWVALDEQRGLIGCAGDDEFGGFTGAAYVISRPALALHSNGEEFRDGDPVELTTCGGLAGASVGLALTAVQGQPTLRWLRFGRFDATGEWRVDAVTPPGLAGVDLQLQSVGFAGSGQLFETRPRILRFR